MVRTKGRRIRRVDPRVVQEAYAQHASTLARRLALIVGDPEEARDIVQRAFETALARGPSAAVDDVVRWVVVVAGRLAIDERRRRRRWGFLAIRDDDASWGLEMDPDLWTALMAIDRRGRAALVLSVLYGYTQQEIADAFGVQRGTVASWITRSRSVLQPMLRKGAEP